MWNKNDVTRRLKIGYPIIQAGMAGGVTTPELVAAVSDSGALGQIGAGYLSADDTEEIIRKVKQLSHKPFGINLFIPEYPEVDQTSLDHAKQQLYPIKDQLGMNREEHVPDLSFPFEQQVEAVIRQGVSVCSFTFGLPDKEIVKDLKKENIVLVGTATTVEEAILNEEAGMDMIVAQGSEAGGHRGTFSSPFEKAMIGTLSLIPQVTDQVNIPVIAAGGIMDARGVMAAFVLGAQGVQMGTAFVTSTESGARPDHKKSVLFSKETDPVITSAFSGKPARGIENEFVHWMEGKQIPPYPVQNSLTKQIRKEAARQRKPEWMSLWSGQSPRLSKKQSASTIISTIAEEVDQITRNFNKEV